MKKIIFFLLIVALATTAQAQNNAIAKYFSRYQSDTSFTKITVTSRMFSLFTEIEADDKDHAEILATIAKLKGIKAIVKNKAANTSTKKLFSDAVNTLEKDGTYEELMTVENAEENVHFMIKEEGNKISELLMVMGGNKNFMVMSLFGEIDLKSIIKLSKVLKIDGMDALQSLEKGGNKK